MSLYTKCNDCDYLSDHNIGEPISIATILNVLEKEHRKSSPNCTTETLQLQISVTDPNIHVKKRARSGRIKLVRKDAAKPGTV